MEGGIAVHGKVRLLRLVGHSRLGDDIASLDVDDDANVLLGGRHYDVVVDPGLARGPQSWVNSSAGMLSFEIGDQLILLGLLEQNGPEEERRAGIVELAYGVSGLAKLMGGELGEGVGVADVGAGHGG